MALDGPSISNPATVGSFVSRFTILVYKEPDTGIAWMAEAKWDGGGSSRCALGDTPRDAVSNLMRDVNLTGTGQINYPALDALEAAYGA